MSPRASRPSPIRSGHPPEPRPVPRRRITGYTAIAILTLFCGVAFAQTPPDSAQAQAAPLGNAQATDVPNDNGKAIHVEWKGGAAGTNVAVARGTSANGPFTALDTVSADAGVYDDAAAPTGKPVYYSLTPVGGTPVVVGPVTAIAQWFNKQRVNIASFVLLFFAFVLYFLWSSRGGKK